MKRSVRNTCCLLHMLSEHALAIVMLTAIIVLIQTLIYLIRLEFGTTSFVVNYLITNKAV